MTSEKETPTPGLSVTRVGRCSITWSESLWPASSWMRGLYKAIAQLNFAVLSHTSMIRLKSSGLIKPSWFLSKYLNAWRRRSPCRPFMSCVNSSSWEDVRIRPPIERRATICLHPRTWFPPRFPMYSLTQSLSKLNGILSGPIFAEKTFMNSSADMVPEPSLENWTLGYHDGGFWKQSIHIEILEGNPVLGIWTFQYSFENEEIVPIHMTRTTAVGDLEEDTELLSVNTSKAILRCDGINEGILIEEPGAVRIIAWVPRRMQSSPRFAKSPFRTNGAYLTPFSSFEYVSNVRLHLAVSCSGLASTCLTDDKADLVVGGFPDDGLEPSSHKTGGRKRDTMQAFRFGLSNAVWNVVQAPKDCYECNRWTRIKFVRLLPNMATRMHSLCIALDPYDCIIFWGLHSKRMSSVRWILELFFFGSMAQ